MTTPHNEHRRVAVIGAGPMGLGAAYQLSLNGYVPIVFEADQKIGGMAASFDFGGLTIERYYHFHCTADAHLFTVLKELGLEQRLRWVSTKMGYYFSGRVQSWGNPNALLSFRGLGLLGKLRYGAHMYLCTKRSDWNSLSGLEATAWIKKWIGTQAFNVLWRPLFELKFYDFAYTLSAAWIWSRIKRVGCSRYDLFHEKLGYIDGGSDLLMNALSAEIIRRGGEVHLSSPVSRVVIEDSAVSGIETSGAYLPFRKVISTVPLSLIPQMIPDLPAEIIDRYRSVQYLSVVCVIVKLRRQLTENFWLNVNDPRMDIPGIIEYTNLRPLAHHIVYVPFYMPPWNPKFQDPDDVFLEKVRRYLFWINPDLSDSDILEMRASRYKQAQPVCPPRFEAQLPPICLPVKGLFAADTSFYYPDDRGISESIGLARHIARMADAT